MPVEDLAAIFAGKDAETWIHSVNGTEILRSSLFHLMKARGASQVAGEACAWVWRSKLTDAGRAETLRVIAEVVAGDKTFEASTLATLLRGRSNDEILAALEGVLQARPEASPEAAEAVAIAFMSRATDLDATECRRLYLPIVLRVWTEIDPEVAIRYAKERTKYPLFDWGFSPTLRRIMAIDATLGVKVLRSAVEGGVDPLDCGNSAFHAGFTAAQLREALAGKSPEEFSNYLHFFATATVFEAPDEVRKLAEAFPARDIFALWSRGEMKLDRGSLAIASGLADRDPEAARAWLATLSPEHRLLVLRATWQFENLGNARFAEICVAEPNYFQDPHSARDVFNAFADGRLDVGLRALALLPENLREVREVEMREAHLIQNFRGDLGSAMAAIESAPEQLRAKLRGAVFGSLSEDDPGQAQQWLKAHPEHEDELAWRIAARTPFLPDSARGQIIGRQLSSDGAPMAIEVYSIDLARHYALTKPLLGASWLEGLPEGPSLPSVTREFAANWADRDADGAANWVRSLEPGAFKDYATLGMVRSLRFEPEEAMRFAESISNPEGRYEAIQQLVDAWKWADLRVASDMVDRAAVSDVQRGELRARLERTNLKGGSGR